MKKDSKLKLLLKTYWELRIIILLTFVFYPILPDFLMGLLVLGFGGLEVLIQFTYLISAIYYKFFYTGFIERN